MRQLVGMTLLLFASQALSQDLQYPVIKGHGGVVTVPYTQNPTVGGKVIIDITADSETGAGTNKSLDRVARLINLYGLAGIQPHELNIVVIIHGEATRSVLTNVGYKDAYGCENPDVDLIKALNEQGVEIMVCSQALIRRGFKSEWLNPDVGLALSAITTLVEYQQKGYVPLIY